MKKNLGVVGDELGDKRVNQGVCAREVWDEGK